MHTTLPEQPLSLTEINRIVSQLRKKGKTLVTTNGCFDLLHAGHIKYLADAAALGDLLVVGINSDASVSRLKGPDRPIQNEIDRALLIWSLKMVDYTFIFPENDPIAFLEILKPDIHVKGGDYTPEQLPEKSIVEKHGGKIVIVPFTSGLSTTSIVKKIITSQS
jgi:glycerol-3-phosphate cytidylyltransferase